MRRALLAVLTMTLAACGDDPAGPGYAPFAGEWRGGVSGLGLRVNVTDTDGTIAGNGSISGVITIQLSISGEHDHPRVEFTGSSPGFESFSFEGRFVSRDKVEGEADGSGFTNDRVILTRQPGSAN